MKQLPALLASAAILGVGFYLAYDWIRASNENPKPSVHSTAVTAAGKPAPLIESRVASSAGQENGKPIDDLTALKEQVALLRAEVLSMRRQNSGQNPAQSDSSENATNNLEKNARTDPQARAEAERAHQKQMAAIETAFRNEPNDAKWSSRASSTIQEAVSGEDAARASMRNIECRSQTCRVEIADDGSGQMDKFMPLLAQRVAQTFPSISANQVDQGNGTSTTVLYMSRSSPRAP